MYIEKNAVTLCCAEVEVTGAPDAVTRPQRGQVHCNDSCCHRDGSALIVKSNTHQKRQMRRTTA